MASHKVNGVNGVNEVNGVPQTNGVSHESDGVHSKNSYTSKFKLPAHFIGGNHVDAAPPGLVKDFVLESGGHTVITNVRPNCDCPAIVLD